MLAETTRRVFARTKRRLPVVHGAGLALVLLAGQALAKIPAAFDRIPKGVVAVVATDNFEQTSKRIRTYAEMLKFEELEGLQELEDTIGDTPGFKKDGSVALVIMPAPEKKAAEGQDAGPSDPMERAILIAQVSDYKAMVKQLGGDPEAKVAKVDGIGDSPTFVRDIGGGWVAMSPAEDPVTNFQPGEKMLKTHEEALGPVGGQIASEADVLVYANMDALRADLEKSIDKASKEVKRGGRRGNPMAGMLPGETLAKLIGPFEQVARAFARDAQACVGAIGLGEKGLSFDLGAQFKAKSEIAGFFNSTGNADGTLAALPASPYLFATSLDTSAPGTRTVIKNIGSLAEGTITTMKDELQKQAEADPAKAKQMETTIKMIDSQTQAVRQFAKNIDKLNGIDAVMGYSPALLAGAGLFSGVVVQQRTSDPGAFKTMLLDQFKLAGAAEGPMKMDASVTPNAAEVGGVKLDSWTVKPKMDPNDPAAAQLAMVNMFIFGATGQMSGFLATTKDALITTYSPNTQVMQQALDARAGKNTLADDKGVAAATAGLPKGSMMRGLIGTKSVFDLVQMGLSFTGKPVQLKVPADVPPIGFAATGDNGGMHIRVYAPTQVLSTIGDVMHQMRGDGDDMDDDNDKKEEKPRF